MHIKKIGVIAREKEIEKKAKKSIQQHGFSYSLPGDLILTIGGDGTFLFAENKYPEIPKLLIRHKSICKRCTVFDLESILKKIKEGKGKFEEIQKLQLVHQGKELHAVNEFTIRNADQRTALRFSLTIDGKDAGAYIGDGAVTATSFGSTGYFHTITGKEFNKGFALALNNTTGKKDPLFFRKEVKIKILRESAIITADNQKIKMLGKPGEVITITPKGLAKILHIHEK